MMRKPLVLALLGLLLAAGQPALASNWSWYVIPSDQGDCGDECYTPPTAWINEADGSFSLGITCEGEMLIEGPVNSDGTVPDKLEMSIDGKSFGSFEIISGLNDNFVRSDPEKPGATGTVRSAILSGSEMTVAIGKVHRFTLGGSRAAIDLMERLCREE